ncbi:MAG: SH3 domain-containing protein [Anaerolineales bacterium]|nr:SH3 domain-containing protein [Anaerolineales bacterium]
MKSQRFFLLNQLMPVLLIVLVTLSCVSSASTTPTAIPAASSSPEVVVEGEATPTSAPVTNTNSNVLYQDDFTNPATGWAAATFDNYFIGYHEPEYYHVEIKSPNSKSTVFEPGQQIFGDATVELKAFTNSTKTDPNGDFRFGLVFRRSGDQYYAFTISPRSKKWYLLKSTPNKLDVLAEGTDNTLHDADENDVLRVDAQASTFFLHINDRLIGQFNDPDYASGEVGFFVQTLDNPTLHIHFDELTVLNFEAPQPYQPQTAELYQDDFTNPATGWSAATFDNYFIGYHEPEYYHIEIKSPNSKSTVFEPGQQIFGDATVELKAFTNSTKTDPNGDFRFGLVFRRSGDQYYAFTISPRSKAWYLLKSTPNELVVIAEGTDNTLHDADIDDVLRVDAQGPTFFLHINGHLVGHFDDPDYTSGEVGFFVQTLDNPTLHIHFDALNIWDFESPRTCNVSTASRVNIRSGPGTTFSSIISVSQGDILEPLGISLDGKWISVKVEGSDQPGWIANSDELISCNVDVQLLPLIGQ